MLDIRSSFDVVFNETISGEKSIIFAAKLPSNLRPPTKLCSYNTRHNFGHCVGLNAKSFCFLFRPDKTQTLPLHGQVGLICAQSCLQERRGGINRRGRKRCWAGGQFTRSKVWIFFLAATRR